jgi:hypothetical protein
MTFQITLNDTFATHIEGVSSEWGIPIEQAVLLILAISFGDKKTMTTFQQIKETMTTLKTAPEVIRQQCAQIMGHGLAGELEGQDFSDALAELVDLVDPADCEWTADA